MIDITEVVKIEFDEDGKKDIQNAKEILELLVFKLLPYDSNMAETFADAAILLNNFLLNSREN